MTNITLQKQHRTLWHFIPGLALSAVITGSPCGVVPFPRLRVPGLVPSPRNLVGDGFRQHHLPAHLEKL